jgi:hypothetical protein
MKNVLWIFLSCLLAGCQAIPLHKHYLRLDDGKILDPRGYYVTGAQGQTLTEYWGVTPTSGLMPHFIHDIDDVLVIWTERGWRYEVKCQILGGWYCFQENHHQATPAHVCLEWQKLNWRKGKMGSNLSFQIIIK